MFANGFDPGINTMGFVCWVNIITRVYLVLLVKTTRTSNVIF